MTTKMSWERRKEGKKKIYNDGGKVDLKCEGMRLDTVKTNDELKL